MYRKVVLTGPSNPYNALDNNEPAQYRKAVLVVNNKEYTPVSLLLNFRVYNNMQGVHVTHILQRVRDIYKVRYMQVSLLCIKCIIMLCKCPFMRRPRIACEPRLANPDHAWGFIIVDIQESVKIFVIAPRPDILYLI